MFKSILPSRRVATDDFTPVTNLMVHPAKENHSSQTPKVPSKRKAKGLFMSTEKKKKYEAKQQLQEQPPQANQDFDKLLDDLQIPTSLRPKLYGMDASVKAAMVKSSKTMAVNLFPPTVQPPAAQPSTSTAKGLRRTRSTDSLNPPRHPTLANLVADDDPSAPLPAPFSAKPVSAYNSPYLPSGRKTSGHSRGLSMDTGRLFSKSQVNIASSSSLDLAMPKPVKGGVAVKATTPTRFTSILTGTSSLKLEIDDVKKLRLMLRNEPAAWSEEFVRVGGYNALLTRLNEILEVEWREEQHDDQILHELLRCFKALSTSSIGCAALRSSLPTPYVQLVALLYSDKKPGEVASRQLIVELLQLLFELYPPSSLPCTSKPQGGYRREAWESDNSITLSNIIILPSPHRNVFTLVRSILLTPAPAPAEEPRTPIAHHEFIENLHVPRIYKNYLQQLSDVCRDYFWVFCHPNNTIWTLFDTDEISAEKPRAPSGMTGGVEYEAMTYFTTHLKFINSCAQAAESLNLPKDHEHSAWRFHHDLFLSGFERIILLSRKASVTYYPCLHLELARYIAATSRAGYELPYTVSRLIGLPPAAHLKLHPPAPLERDIPVRQRSPSRLGKYSDLPIGSPSKRTSTSAANSRPSSVVVPSSLDKMDIW